MASEIQVSNRKRKLRGGGGNRNKTKKKPPSSTGPKPKVDKRTKRLFQKRARNYNSDSSDEEEEDEQKEEKEEDTVDITEEYKQEEDDEEEDNDGEEEIPIDNDEEDAIQPGIAKFSQGCNAFKMAFTKITNKSVPDDLLGPVLSGHKKLIAEKLAEEESQLSVKGVAKKEKQLLAEKGHVKPANFLDSHEKFLIGVATKGVVKLFNAVNKAQNAQKGLNPSRFKDAKELGKRKKQAFFTELRKKASQGNTATEGSDEPAWAPLRDSYMLTNSKLKNWDKMQDKTVDDDMVDAASHGSSSDED